MKWQDIARFVIDNGRVKNDDSEELEGEVIFEAQEQGASPEEAQDLGRKAKAWYERAR